MTLNEQIASFVFSFLYGIFSQKLYRIFYKQLHTAKIIYKILNSLLFTLNLTLIYFKIFYLINDGMINSIFIIITLSTFLYFNNKNLQKKCKNMCN